MPSQNKMFIQQRGSIAIVDVFLIVGVVMIVFLTMSVSSSIKDIYIADDDDTEYTRFRSELDSHGARLRMGKVSNEYSIAAPAGAISMSWGEIVNIDQEDSSPPIADKSISLMYVRNSASDAASGFSVLVTENYTGSALSGDPQNLSVFCKNSEQDEINKKIDIKGIMPIPIPCK